MAVGVAVAMMVVVCVPVVVGMGVRHPKMLYYNITGVHRRYARVDGLKGATGCVANAVNNDSCGVRSIEDHIGIRAHDNTTDIAPVGGTSSMGMISDQVNDSL